MIRPEETMVFGDQLNDIEMLNQAYYSFAVANGRPETRAAARFLADSNVNQGPLKVLKLLVGEIMEKKMKKRKKRVDMPGGCLHGGHGGSRRMLRGLRRSGNAVFRKGEREYGRRRPW